MADGKDNNMAFLDEGKKGPKLHVKDIVFIVLRNLHWLILCAAVGAFVAGYWVRHQNHVYQSSARVLIKGSSTGSNDNSSIREASIKSMFATRALYNSNINNEMMIFSSKSAMLEVARALELNVFYTSKTKIVNRVKDLYGESPIKVDFIDNGEDDVVAFDAVINSTSSLTLTQPGYEPVKVECEDTVAMPFGRIVVHPTWFMSSSFVGQTLHVEHRSMNAVADYYRAAMQVFRDDDFNTIITIVLQDASPIRATEVINGREVDAVERIMELTEGRGVDLAIETAGTELTARQSIFACNKGATVVFVGYTASGEMTLPHSQILDKELTIRGIFRYRHIYPMAIEAIADGRVPIKKIVTNMFQFPNVQEALDACVNDKANIVKGVIKIC